MSFQWPEREFWYFRLSAHCQRSLNTWRKSLVWELNLHAHNLNTNSFYEMFKVMQCLKWQLPELEFTIWESSNLQKSMIRHMSKILRAKNTGVLITKAKQYMSFQGIIFFSVANCGARYFVRKYFWVVVEFPIWNQGPSHVCIWNLSKFKSLLPKTDQIIFIRNMNLSSKSTPSTGKEKRKLETNLYVLIK